MKSSCFFIAGSLLFAGCAGSLPPPGVWEYTGGPFAQNVSTLLVDRQFPTALYAGLTNGQIFSSTDDGASWFFVATIRPGSVIRSIVQNPDNPATFFAATSDGAFASEDGASTWRVVSLFPAGLPPVGVRVIAFDPWKPNILYAGSEARGS